jgi:hypothetical protein
MAFLVSMVVLFIFAAARLVVLQAEPRASGGKNMRDMSKIAREPTIAPSIPALPSKTDVDPAAPVSRSRGRAKADPDASQPPPSGVDPTPEPDNT